MKKFRDWIPGWVPFDYEDASGFFQKWATAFAAFGVLAITATIQLWEFPYPRLVYGSLAVYAATTAGLCFCAHLMTAHVKRLKDRKDAHQTMTWIAVVSVLFATIGIACFMYNLGTNSHYRKCLTSDAAVCTFKSKQIIE